MKAEINHYCSDIWKTILIQKKARANSGRISDGWLKRKKTGRTDQRSFYVLQKYMHTENFAF